MSTSCIRLYLIPRAQWASENESGLSLHTLAEEALRAETRLAKDVAAERELRRYLQLCSRIENLCESMTAESTQSVDISAGEGATYYEEIINRVTRHLGEEAGRWGASFFPPGRHVQAHFNALESDPSPSLEHRRELFRKADQMDAGVVEVIVFPCTRPTGYAESKAVPPIKEIEWATREGFSLPEQIGIALANDTPINFSNFRHREITEALRDRVFGPHEANHLRVVFADGSEAAPFPLSALRLSPVAVQDEPTLTAVLISGRHPELDRQSDMAVLRNAEIAASQTMAEQEALSMSKASNILHSPALTQGGVLHVYHTGLEPVVLGFYRAVVNVLREQAGQPPSLVVVPIYHKPARVRVPRPSAELRRLQERYPQAVRLLKRTDSKGEHLFIRWLIDRPMNIPELQLLREDFPNLSETIEHLHAASQYIRGAAWGPCS